MRGKGGRNHRHVRVKSCRTEWAVEFRLYSKHSRRLLKSLMQEFEKCQFHVFKVPV